MKKTYQIAVDVTSMLTLSFLAVVSLIATGLIGRALWEGLLLGWNLFNIWG